jgi:branched-chain amino acid transport system permease protein
MRAWLLNLAAVGMVALALALLVGTPGTGAFVSALSLVFIWGIAAISLNLINGQLGVLSLGHHGFMLIGGYVTALLMLPEAERAPSRTRLLSDWARQNLSLDSWLYGLGLDAVAESVYLKFIIALIIAGLVAALLGLVVGIPSLRIRGDYLAIVTFGFGEIIRLLPNAPEVAAYTNGPLGLKGIPSHAGGIWFTFIALLVVIFIFARLKFSSYGRAIAGIREDEIAAQAMGVNLAYHKVLAFVISAFFAGVAGGLYASYLQSVDTQTFNFFITFFLLVAISLGGLGSITGALFGTAVVVLIRFYGGFLEERYPMSVGLYATGGLLVAAFAFSYLVRRARRLRPVLEPKHYLVGMLGALAIVATPVMQSVAMLQEQIRFFGMRRILLAVVLILLMIYRREGAFGRAEFNWQLFFGPRRATPTDEERAQDAWLKNVETEAERQDDEGREA